MDPPSVEARPRRVRFRLAVPRQGDERVGGGVGSARLEAQGRSARESGALEETGSAGAGDQVEWRWIAGHAGHAKNEYADVLATRAAERQERSNGLVPSGFDTWLAQERARGRYTDYDPDQELHERL